MACCLGGAPLGVARAATLHRVEFPSAAGQSPAGAPDEPDRSAVDTLQGYLARPAGDGAHPAVVALHGCGGPNLERMHTVADALASWGYVVLFVDSFSTRGIYHLCTPDKYAAEKLTVAKRPLDALGALRFLAQQQFVDPGRVAVVGFSQGAETALKIAERLSLEASSQPGKLAFRAAVAFYPPCRRAGARPVVPTLIAIGALDDWTPAEDCSRVVAGWGEGGAPVELVVYPGAHHTFDAPILTPGRRMYGHWLEHNPQAAEEAYRKMRDFLGHHLGR
jgi:dienelactone hydrolase